jgi:hypothetical protein
MADEKVVDPVNDTVAVGTDTTPVGDAGAGVAEAKPFFTYKSDNGETHDYRNAGELADAFKHASFRKADHDLEMGKVSSRAKYLEEQISKSQALERTLSESQAMRYHKFLIDNPQKAARIKAEFEAESRSGTPDFGSLFDEKLRPIIEKQEGLEKAEESRAAAGRQEAARGRMKERYPGFDDSLVQAEMKRIQELPKQDMDYALYELMWNVVQGRSNPAELERRSAEAAARRKSPSVTSTPGVKPTGRDPNGMSPSERREAGLRLLNG